MGNTRRHPIAPALALLAVFAPPAAAYQPLITDDTGTQGKRGNQIEASHVQSVEKGAGATATTRMLPLVYTRGLTDTLDAYVGPSYVRFSPPPGEPKGSGAGNPALGVKWRFHENEAQKLSFAFKPELRLPVSDGAETRGLGSGRSNAGAMLILTQETGFGAIHANLAVNTNRFALQDNRDLNRSTLWCLSVAPVYEPAPEWKIALDAGIVTNAHKAEKAGMGYVELGVVFSPNKDLDLALGVIRDVHHRGHRVTTATAGVTWRFRQSFPDRRADPVVPRRKAERRRPPRTFRRACAAVFPLACVSSPDLSGASRTCN